MCQKQRGLKPVSITLVAPASAGSDLEQRSLVPEVTNICEHHRHVCPISYLDYLTVSD
jgi:hypothetical protein